MLLHREAGRYVSPSVSCWKGALYIIPTPRVDFRMVKVITVNLFSNSSFH